MASIAATCRLSARYTARRVRRKVGVKEFSSASPRWAASNFVMPAMSPTMTEGNIASWKVKEGDSFKTGDVLLEIETDKAQMDVEAQDDGIVAKIMQQDGSKSVKVGARIAVLAEPNDDIQSIEIPEEKPPAASPSTKESKASSESSQQEKSDRGEKESQTPSDSSSGPQKQSSPTPSHQRQNSTYPLYPSVQHLLHTNGISSEESSKIQATGPSGRLLKGDVLAHLGSIDKSYSAELSKRLEKLSHLDLSNIKKAQPKPPGKMSAKDEAAAQEQEVDTQLAVPISLAAVLSTQRRIQESLGLTLPLSTFIARASEIANENLPKAIAATPDIDELFDAILGLDPVGERGTRGSYIPHITALLPPSSAALSGPISQHKGKDLDIIDTLAGKKPRRSPPASQIAQGGIRAAAGASGADNIFSVTVGKGEEKRARVYLERVKSVLEAEPGRCVL